eukprot:TRINITY_DN67784_c3_g16_i1.p1 TRINITY_DN67784_c3_g16~~TRINITY_DN67784_c3_g16_i1.p1  ORF type:complete len:697 (-),score=82.20 TRINITY_DN67784_c3_g16_i1:187-2277(-)
MSTDDLSSEGSIMELHNPLTSEEKRAVMEVVEAYKQFWNHIKFRKGWAQPPIRQDTVEDLLTKAAEFVVRIRKHLDSKTDGVTLRLRDGSAQDFLWDIDFVPKENPERFVKELVHATFKDSRGYVEGLSEEMVDEYMTEIKDFLQGLPHSHHNVHHSTHNCKQLCESLQTLTEAVQQSINKLGVFSSDDNTDDKVHRRKLAAACKCLSRANVLLKEVNLDVNPSSQLQVATDGGAEIDKDAEIVSPTQRKRRRKRGSTLEEPTSATSTTTDKEPDSNSGALIVATPTSVVSTTSGEAPQTFQQPQLQPPDGVAPAASSPPAEQPPKPDPVQVDEEEPNSATSIMSEPPPPATPTSMGKPDDGFLVEIGRVEKDVKEWQGNLNQLQADCTAPQLQSLVEHPEQGEKVIEKLQERALATSHYLMKDILALDQITCHNMAERKKRKEQVVAIQDILDTVDELSNKLRDFAKVVKERKQVEEEERKKQEEAERQALEAKRAPAKEKILNLFSPKPLTLPADKWKEMVLEPKFEVDEQPTLYAVQCYLPDIRKQDVSIDLNQDYTQLIINGFKIPHATSDLRKYADDLIARIDRGEVSPESVINTPDEQLLLSTGAGVYGSFTQAYSLPQDVLVDKIHANYQNGVLKVIIPRPAQTRADPFSAFYNHPFAQHPRQGYTGRGASRRTPPRGNWGSQFDDLLW